MPIKRDVKTLASRLDRRYIERHSAVRRVRVALIVACVAAALGWYAFASRGFEPDAEIYNPGHVTSVHANFANNCLACHDAAGDGKKKFLLTVSDTACVKCHDGSIHDENQKRAQPGEKIDRNGVILAVNLPKAPAKPGDAFHTAGMRSASCISCHTEHRGEELLKGTSDSNCVKCHANLSNSLSDKALAARKEADANRDPAFEVTKIDDASQTSVAWVPGHEQESITLFAMDKHPAFGRTLLRSVKTDELADGKPKEGGKSVTEQRLFDPTKLRFNHRLHAKQEGIKGNDGCIKCHETQPIATPPIPETDDGKLYLSRVAAYGGVAEAWKGGSLHDLLNDQKYTRPVNFYRHCASCHAMNVDPVRLEVFKKKDDGSIEKEDDEIFPGMAVPHADLATVNAVLESAVNTQLRGKIEDQKALIELAAVAAGNPDKKDVDKDIKDAIDKARAESTKEIEGKLFDTLRDEVIEYKLSNGQKVALPKLDAPEPPAEGAEKPADGAAAPPMSPSTGGLILDGRPGYANLYAMKATLNPNANSCIYCHSVEQGAAGTAAVAAATDGEKKDEAPKEAATPPADAPADAAPTAVTFVPLSVAPTGIPEITPRRWFDKSFFDHRKHNNMSCVECHSTLGEAAVAKADADAVPRGQGQTDDTSFVNSPNLTWNELFKSDAGKIEMRQRSCVECHHPDNATGRGVANDCVSCHQFHDRTKEMPVGLTR